MARKEPQKLKSTVGSLVADGHATLQGLGEELREWYDNLPEQFQSNRSDIDEAAGTLENLTEPDAAPDAVSELEVEYVNTVGKRTGRSARGGQATYEMQAAKERAEEWVEAQRKTSGAAAEDAEDALYAQADTLGAAVVTAMDKYSAESVRVDDDRGGDGGYRLIPLDAEGEPIEAAPASGNREEQIAEVEAWIEAVQEIIDEAEGVEYPGMFG